MLNIFAEFLQNVHRNIFCSCHKFSQGITPFTAKHVCPCCNGIHLSIPDIDWEEYQASLEDIPAQNEPVYLLLLQNFAEVAGDENTTFFVYFCVCRTGEPHSQILVFSILGSKVRNSPQFPTLFSNFFFWLLLITFCSGQCCDVLGCDNHR